MPPYQPNALPNTDFPHTDWSLIHAVQQETDPRQQREVLGRFLEQYMPAMRSYLIASRYYQNVHDTEDLLSDFVSDKIIAAHLLGRVRKGDGRLRTFLLVCLNNYAKSKLRKRVPIGSKAVGGAAHDLDGSEAMRHTTEQGVFDLAWARTVINRTIQLTREECVGSLKETDDTGQHHIWRVFEARLVLPMTGQLDKPVEYETLSKQLGATSIKQVQNWLVTGVRKFQRNMAIVVGEYALSNDDIDQEIGELFEIFRRQSS